MLRQSRQDKSGGGTALEVSSSLVRAIFIDLVHKFGENGKSASSSDRGRQTRGSGGRRRGQRRTSRIGLLRGSGEPEILEGSETVMLIGQILFDVTGRRRRRRTRSGHDGHVIGFRSVSQPHLQQLGQLRCGGRSVHGQLGESGRVSDATGQELGSLLLLLLLNGGLLGLGLLLLLLEVLLVVHEVAPRAVGAESGCVVGAAPFALVLGVARDLSQLCVAVGELALFAVLAVAILAKGTAEFGLIPGGVDLLGCVVQGLLLNLRRDRVLPKDG